MHETYARLADVEELDVVDRQHFFAYVARAMRFVVVDFARRRNAGKRGGGSEHVAIDENVAEVLVDRLPGQGSVVGRVRGPHTTRLRGA